MSALRIAIPRCISSRLVASGTFQADGSFVPAGLIVENILRELFEVQVYKLLVSKELIDADLIAKMRAWKHNGFHVYVGPSIRQKEDGVRVGLYIVRAPASASRLLLAEKGLLKYLAKGLLPNDRCDTLFEAPGRIFDYLVESLMSPPIFLKRELILSIIMAPTQTRIVAREPNSETLL